MNDPESGRPAIERLVAIMARLRGPDGCPWDHEQTYRSLRGYVLEEAHEVAEAIDGGCRESLREELGDLLLQVVFLSRLAEEDGLFRFDDVAAAISEKLVRRHPHVFGDEKAADAEQAFRRWDASKAAEAKDAPQRSRLDGLPRGLPALLRAQRLAERAARTGFDWPDERAVIAKIREEVGELEAALDDADEGARDEELGDLLFACASLARRAGLDPEGALGRANLKFERRFREVEKLARERGLALDELDDEALDGLWREAKANA